MYLTYGGDRHAYAEQQRQRGYLSTMDAVLHFGLGSATLVDSLLVVWPGGRISEQTRVAADRRLLLSHSSSTAPDEDTGPRTAAGHRRPAWSTPRPTGLQALDASLPYHRESPYSDFDNFALAVRDYSHDGPALTTADLDGDGREELLVGGAAGQAVTAYHQVGDSLLVYQELLETQETEATVLLTLDYDGDGDIDLFVGNGSREFSARESYYRDELYENVAGKLVRTTRVLPDYLTVTATAAVADLEGDGDLDLFVGSRSALSGSPQAAPSFVLVNEGSFRIGQEVEAGRVTGAVWTDLNGDGLPDLATVGEWDAPQVFTNVSGGLRAHSVGDELTGWWYSLTLGDPDGDGDTDLLAGNVGLNSFYRANATHPLRLRVADYDDNGTLDPILMMYNGAESYPVHPRNTLGRQLPGFKKQAVTYAEYGGWREANMPDIGPEGFVLEAKELRSIYLENDGHANFTVHYLPAIAQTAPLRDAVTVTLADGRRGWLVVQNDYATEVLGGQLDAGTGFLLTVDSADRPVVDPDYWSVRGDARSVVQLDSLVVVGINSGRLRLYRPVK